MMNRPQYSMIERIGPPVMVGVLVCLWVVTRFFPGDQTKVTQEHLVSQRGGRLIALAGNRYHLELVADGNGGLNVYTLGADPSQVLEVDRQELTAYLVTEGRSTAVTLAPAPQPGDRPGRTSRFSGTLPSEIRGGEFAATIPNVRIHGNRYHARFERGEEQNAMPAAIAQEEARAHYLVPAGKYSRTDIRQNGGITAAQKYRNFQPRHDPHPKPGDPVCPVTKTKANPACTWIIDGQVYQFCCPPCIDEYVRLAKEQPDQLKPPEAFSQTTTNSDL